MTIKNISDQEMKVSYPQAYQATELEINIRYFDFWEENGILFCKTIAQYSNYTWVSYYSNSLGVWRHIETRDPFFPDQ